MISTWKARSVLANRLTRTSTRFEHIDSTTGTPEALWACWTDVTTWSDWAGWVVSASIEGPFGPGTKGVVVQRDGRRSELLITAVTPLVSHEFTVHVPGADVHMRREILDASQRTTFKHSVWLEGPLAGLWTRPLSARARVELPETMRRLAAHTAAAYR
ncbi:MAG: hypothetical protein WA880_02120 [Ornithinimicrobium sp.]